MRSVLLALSMGMAVVALAAAEPAGKVEIKNVQLCCIHTVERTTKVLANVAGLSNVVCDLEGKTIAFTARDAKAAQAGVLALFGEGFHVKATLDGQELPAPGALPKAGSKADVVTVNDVHVCCKPNQAIILDLFKKDPFQGATVRFAKQGVRRNVVVTGKELDKAAVLETLTKGGFYGKVK